MRYVETLTKEAGNRLHATTERALKSKVASSNRPQHKGYPDEVGYVPFITVDPTHGNQVNADQNLCADTDPGRATTFTATLGFPHLSIRQNARGRFTAQKLVSHANCDAHSVFEQQDETVKTVLHERERLRMKAVADDHEYNLDNETTLTADPVDKILINATRTAKRRDGAVTAEGVQEVLNFGRNDNLRKHLPFEVSEVTTEFLAQRIDGKTCSPPIPQNEAQRAALLHYIDNPDATINEVIEATGYNRGNFETFRLNRPDPHCYNREYIESLDFDADTLVSRLQAWMENSPHAIYDCRECSSWSYSKQGLSTHKSNRDDHETNAVLTEECPTDTVTEPVGSDEINYSTDVDTGDLLDQFSTEVRATTPEDPSEGDAPDDAGGEEANPDSSESGTATADGESLSERSETPSSDEQATTATCHAQLTPETLMDATDEPITEMADAIGLPSETLLLRFFTTLSEVEKQRILDTMAADTEATTATAD